ncbi:MAG: sensor histidine kinase [Candidatus Dormibacteria bacterium]
MSIEASVQDFIDLTLELSGTLDPKAVIQRILERSVAVAAVDRATLSSLRDGEVTVEGGVGWGEEVRWERRTYGAGTVRRHPAVVEVITTKRTVLGPAFDITQAEPDDREALAKVRHTAVVPLLEDGEVVGLLVLSRYDDRPFVPQDIPVLTGFGALAGLALRNATMYEEAAVAARRLQAAASAAGEVASMRLLPELLAALIRRACEAAGADSGAVMRHEGADAVIEATSGVAPVGARFPLGPDIQDAVAADAVIQIDVAGQPGTEAVAEFVQHYAHALVTPLRFDGQLLGLLVLARRQNRPPFSDDDIAALRAFAALAAMVLHSGRLVHQLRDVEAAKREFMNIAVHEMRRPLTIIEGYSEMLLADLPDADAAVLQQLATIRRQAEHARGLAEDLLILARLESDELGVRSDTILVPPLIAEVVDRLRPRAEQRRGEIAVSDLDALAVRGDRNLLERIVDNLVGNAIDYSSEPPAVTIDASRANGEVLIRVGDQGVGVPPEEQETIFGRFARGSRAGRVRGSGLGLYLSRECARRMGGDIVLEDAPRPAGSSFVLRLPAADPGR